MTDLKVRVVKGDTGEPVTTVTVPGGVLKFAIKLLPQRALGALKAEGVDLDEVVRLAESNEVRGQLAEIEDHQKNERVVISLE